MQVHLPAVVDVAPSEECRNDIDAVPRMVQAGLTVCTPVFNTLLRLTALDSASTAVLEDMLEAALDRGATHDRCPADAAVCANNPARNHGRLDCT